MDRANVAATLHEHLCTHDWHGYSQSARWGDGEGTCDVSCEGRTWQVQQGDRDCSSSVIECWQVALQGSAYEGRLDNATYTGNMRSVFVNSGLFEWKPMSFIAQRGDIYLNEANHTAMCQSAVPDMLSEFSINEFGGITGGQVGDQTGRESSVHGYYDFPWNGILHYNGKADEGGKPEPQTSVSEVRYRASVDPNGKEWLNEYVGFSSPYDNDGFVGIKGKPMRWLAMDFNGWYQVKTEKNGWLPKVRAYDVNDLEYGCAGDGSPIVAIRCYYETLNPSKTGYHVIEYEAGVLGGGWLGELHDLKCVDGDSDDFAGNGKRIDRFKARIIKE